MTAKYIKNECSYHYNLISAIPKLVFFSLFTRSLLNQLKKRGQLPCLLSKINKLKKIVVSGLLTDFESATWIKVSGCLRMYSPTVVFRGVDGAVGEVGSSTDLRQTFSVQEGPGTPMVGRKLQADTDNTRTSTM